MARRGQMTTAAETSAEPDNPAAGWLGFKVDGLDFDGGGRVDGLYADAVDGLPTWVVIRLSRFGRRTAVPYEWVAPGIGRVWIPAERALLRAAPSVDPGSTLLSGVERKLISHFSLGEDGRAAAI